MQPVELDAAWRAEHPLPTHGDGTTKNSRGKVLAVGGSRMVPGALRLVGEAALRAGAGKLQMATIGSAALLLGMAMPEAAAAALGEDADGEILVEPADALLPAIDRADSVILGPGMGDREAAASLVRRVASQPREHVSLVLDAEAVACAGPLCDLLVGYAGRLVVAPHLGEMAALMGCEAAEIELDPAAAARDAAVRFGAVVVLKGTETVIASPEGALLHYRGGGIGLATGGSGDVLAGVIGGLLSRGAAPLVAAGWGVWMHGEAGRALAGELAPLGFLARELLPHLSGLLPR